MTSIAFPALGSGVGGYPLEEGARITVSTVREELPRARCIAQVVFALRGAAAYAGFSRGTARKSRAMATGGRSES